MRNIWRSTFPIEKASICAFAIILLSALWFELAPGMSGLVPAAIGLTAALILTLLSVFGFIWAASYADTSRWRVGLAAPVLLIASLLLFYPIMTASRTLTALMYLYHNEAEFRQSKVPGYSVMPFQSGIPDGGTAIVRTSSLRPDQLPQSEMVDIVGERIRWCSILRKDHYLCGYD